MQSRLTATALVLAATLTLAACSIETPAPAPTPTGSAHANEGHDEHELVPSPTATPDAAAASQAAVDALTAYGDRDQSFDTWFSGLKPHLYETAVDEYSTVNPTRIPVFDITGDAAVLELTDSDRYAVLSVPTSIGDYIVELRRDADADPWGATRFQPPTQ